MVQRRQTASRGIREHCASLRVVLNHGMQKTRHNVLPSFYLFIFFKYFWDKGSLCSPHYSGTYYEDQANLELRHPSTSVSQMLVVYDTTPTSLFNTLLSNKMNWQIQFQPIRGSCGRTALWKDPHPQTQLYTMAQEPREWFSAQVGSSRRFWTVVWLGLCTNHSWLSAKRSHWDGLQPGMESWDS